MLVFRVLCAIFVAWAMNWAFGRPEADLLREELPEFVLIAPFAGALVGFVNLARRQGWGGVVALANGIWAGVLSLILTSVFFVVFKVYDTGHVGDTDFDFVAALMAKTTAEVMDQLANFPLLLLAIGASATVGLVTEAIHWALVRLRRQAGIQERNTRRIKKSSMY